MEKRLLTGVLLLVTLLIDLQAQRVELPAGVFKLGIVGQGGDRWLSPDEKPEGMSFQWKTLTDTKGSLLEVSVSTQAMEGDTLYWSFGDCLPDADVNVFSVEGRAFTCYYGESMKLRTVQVLTPTDDIRLGDGHKSQTPVSLYESGKRTERPLLVGRCPLRKGDKLYFCFYEQCAKADYNYYLLPALFRKL